MTGQHIDTEPLAAHLGRIFLPPGRGHHNRQGRWSRPARWYALVVHADTNRPATGPNDQDYEPCDTLPAAKDILRRQYRSPEWRIWPAAVHVYSGPAETEHGHFRDIGPAAWYRDEQPDRVLTIGPRGGVHTTHTH